MGGRTTAECLTLLDLEKPNLTGKSQDEVDAKLAAWKTGILKSAYKTKAHEVHPDKHPEDPEAGVRFRAVKEAFEQLQGLAIRLKRPEKNCPNGHPREPVKANYCHECGYSFLEDPLIDRLRQAGLTESSIVELQRSGELTKMRGRPVDDLVIKLLLYRQRHDLFGSLYARRR